MKKLYSLIIIFIASLNAFAQEESMTPLDSLSQVVSKLKDEISPLKRIKASGYIQAQFQVADSAGAPSYNGGNFAAGVDKRFMVRRGRIKFQYDGVPNEKGISASQYVLQFDVGEKGLTVKDAYARFTDPWTGWFSVTGGIFNRPFGYEISYSSSQRESPERGRMSQILFPGERDLGASLIIQGPKNSNWNWLKAEAGYFNGTGAPGALKDGSEFDKYKDFIGRVSANRVSKNERIKYGIGLSYYSGSYRIDSVNVYDMIKTPGGIEAFSIVKSKSEISENISHRPATTREYTGADAQLSIDWKPGITTLRGEFISGTQPGFSGSSTSPAAAISSDIYYRKFNGAYFYFLQNILQTPLQLIVKYDWYDPNTNVEDDEIGKSESGYKSTNATDLRYDTWGFGLSYRWDSNLRITAYYDYVTNESSTNLSGYQTDRLDNIFTLRVQVKF